MHHALLQSQISKTARVADKNMKDVMSSKETRINAVKLLNRDLIASSENLNDFSPKGAEPALTNSTAQNLNSGSVLNGSSEEKQGANGAHVARSNNQNKSQYFAKYSHDATKISNNNSSSPLESLKGKSQLHYNSPFCQ